MATAFSKNQQVRLKAVVPQGPVQALRMDEDGVVSYLVQWTDANGQSQSRWFTEDELEAA
jgi:uncharacterized protein YodC (DUF2158 family)